MKQYVRVSEPAKNLYKSNAAEGLQQHYFIFQQVRGHKLRKKSWLFSFETLHLLPIVVFSFIHTSVFVCVLISSFCWEYQCVSHMYNCCYQNSDEDNLNNKRLILYHSSRYRVQTVCY